MSKIFWQVLKATPAILGASLIATTSAIAGPETETNTSEILNQVNQYNQSQSQDQVTNVSQLRDVQPGDWAYEALRTLVERYGCIVGYPDQTYRGNNALSRYEFAAGLNSCLQQMERLIASSQAVLQADIERLQRLMQEFEAELVAIGARVDNLEGRVAFLEENQFSTTTKLQGEAIFGLTGAWAGDKATPDGRDPFEQTEDNVFLSARVRLDFQTSFTGQDRLSTRLQWGNTPNLREATGTSEARLAYTSDTNDDIELDRLWYRTRFGENITVHLSAKGTNLDDFFTTTRSFFDSSGTGSLSRFFQRNPVIYRQGDAGVGVNWQFAEQFGVDVGYLGGEDTSSTTAGLFGGEYLAAFQFNWDPNQKLGVSVFYGYGYQPEGETSLGGSTGGDVAENPFLFAGRPDARSFSHRVGLQANWQIAEQFNLGGWFGYVNSTGKASGGYEETANIFTGAIQLAVLDLAREGSVLGFMVGVPPYSDDFRNQDLPFMLEAMYKYPLTDNISVTPGAYVIFNPQQNNDNDTIVVGTIRTVFRF